MVEIGAAAQADKIIEQSSAASELAWKEDSNSPTDLGSGSSLTYNCGDTYDQWLVFFTIDNSSGGTGRTVSLIINGDTGTNYYHITQDGTKTNGDTKMDHVAYTGDGTERQFAFTMAGTWSDAATWTRDLGDGGQARLMSADYQGASPLSSFTFEENNGDSLDNIRVAVFGRDV